MASRKNLTTNTAQNFILKGFNSIQIGLYMLMGVYVINAAILGFIADSNPLGMLSIEIIESICMFMVVLVGFFSMFAVFFSSRRAARKAGVAVWNAASKKQFGLYALSCDSWNVFIVTSKKHRSKLCHSILFGVCGAVNGLV